VLFGALSGCALQGFRHELPSDPTLPVQTLLTDVPFFAQKAFQCGPAALAMALQNSGVVVSPDDLVQMVYIPDRKGSLQSGLIGGARRNGRLAYPIEGLDCLIRELAADHPVIVLQNLGLSWLPRWHYAVAVGYDLNREDIILHTGTIAHRRVGLSTFRRTWKRAEYWGLLVLPAEHMPACAEEQDYLKAVMGIQQTGQHLASQGFYQAAVRRWPQSFHARMGLGNAQYANQDLDGAVQSFHTAAGLTTDNGDALNNLAHVLAQRGDLDEALSVIRQALASTGDNRQTYLQTFDEIKMRMGMPAP
jgi:tetratricopeptide (TPR) repeat protein